MRITEHVKSAIEFWKDVTGNPLTATNTIAELGVTLSASRHLWPRHNIALEVRAVDVRGVARIGRLDVARDLRGWRHSL